MSPPPTGKIRKAPSSAVKSTSCRCDLKEMLIFMNITFSFKVRDFVNFKLLTPSIEYKDASLIVSILSNNGGEYPKIKPSPTEVLFPTVPPSTTLVPGCIKIGQSYVHT